MCVSSSRIVIHMQSLTFGYSYVEGYA